MTLEELTNGMRDRVGEDCGLGASVAFDFGDDGRIFLDANTVPNVVSNGDDEADCTISVSLDDFVSMVNGELDGTTAFMMGKLKVAGNMGVAMKIGTVLG